MGIIPARAGFTGWPGTRRCGPSDHPRSRGVYQEESAHVGRSAGSSPLARGLLNSNIGRMRAARIIPARAGFTLGPKYAGAGDSGSSPLARGLPEADLDSGPYGGIIPARAGFTPPTGALRMCRSDHPRSRGVYAGAVVLPRRGLGSSPLARGLRRWPDRSGAGRGIIPARAGFTDLAWTLWNQSKDHPRSRGVYRLPALHRLPHRGSSPLARGLPSNGGAGYTAPGIIPARAGFTRGRGGTDGAHRDHPRSRGVYRRGTRPPTPGAGSSPLARGLPLQTPGGPLGDGIIPARAGFTVRGAPGGLGEQDHPRSRGVYRDTVAPVLRKRGSSPLARGLLLRGGGHEAPVRIIPARAGFTRPDHQRRRVVMDHPRSRGVYYGPRSWPDPKCGSSPLARGLHQTGRDDRGDHRIIPARAGFTQGAGLPHADARDHPRSRGVYLAPAHDSPR